MPLPIRDGNQSLTTLSTILVSNAHIPAHTVISFGTQGITDIATAVSGVELGPNTLNALENITVTLGQVTITGGLTDTQLRASAVTIGGTVTVGSIVTHGVTIANSSVTIGGSVTATISGTPSVTFSQASITFGTAVVTGSTSILNFPATQTVTFTQASVTFSQPTITGSVSVLNFPASQSVTFSQAPVTFGLISGTVTANPTGTQIISGSVTIGAGTAQIGSVTASLAYSQTATTISSTAVTAIPVVFPTSGAYGGSLQGYNGANTYIYSGIQAIGNTSLASATSLPVSLGTLPALVAGTAQIGSVTVGNTVTIAGTVTANPTGTQTIAGTVTANAGGDFANSIENVNDVGNVSKKIAVQLYDDNGGAVGVSNNPLPISGTVTANLGSALPTGTNQIGVVTIGNTVTIANIQGTTVTTSNFTSTTPSTVLANFSANREVLTIFNEGAGNLHICAGATCTTIAYQVRLSAGDYYEVPLNQTSLTHSAVFATTGTARVCQVS